MAALNGEQVVVIAGLGTATGTGAACARLFGRTHGYSVALISRPRDEVRMLEQEIKEAGGRASTFSVDTYDQDNLERIFAEIDETWPNAHLACAIWNAVEFSLSPFLDITPSDIRHSVAVNIVAATAFAQLALRRFLRPAAGGAGPGPFAKGTLIFTGASSAVSSRAGAAAFSAGKHGLRALSQSIAREFGPQGVHVSFVIIAGTIVTRRTQAALGNLHGPRWMDDEARRLSPESVARTYLFLHEQDPSAWTSEMDLRPAKAEF